MIVVTRGGKKKQKKTDPSRSQDKSDGSGHVKASSSQAPSKEIKNKTLDDDDAMNDSNSEGSSDQGDLTDQEEESDGEDTASDSDGRRDDPVGERVAKKPVTGDEGRDRDSLRTVLVKSGRHSSGSQRRGSSTWQVWKSTGQTGQLVIVPSRLRALRRCPRLVGRWPGIDTPCDVVSRFFCALVFRVLGNWE